MLKAEVISFLILMAIRIQLYRFFIDFKICVLILTF